MRCGLSKFGSQQSQSAGNMHIPQHLSTVKSETVNTSNLTLTDLTVVITADRKQSNTGDLSIILQKKSIQYKQL